MHLRDPDAAAMLAGMQVRHRATLLLVEPSSAPPAPTGLGRQRHGGPGGQPPFDYAAWARDLGAWVAASPRTCAEIAERYGLVRGTARERLSRARKTGHWPPAGKSAMWKRNGYGPPRLTLVEAG